MYLGKRYTCKDDLFKLQCSGTESVVRMYQNKRFVTFERDDLRYLMNMLHIVQDQQSRYILARDDV
jgi:predicted AAA+ superfamily ATPase